VTENETVIAERVCCHLQTVIISRHGTIRYGKRV